MSKKYVFEYDVIDHGQIEIEADSWEEAEEKFKKEFERTEIGYLGGYELVDVEE